MAIPALAPTSDTVKTLEHFNKTSGKFGQWDLYIYDPQKSVYEWKDKKTGEQKRNEIFQCYL